MLGFLTIVAFVIAWNAGGWWWLIAIVMGLVWGGKQEEKKKAVAAPNQPVVVAEPNSTPTSADPTGDARNPTEQLSNVNDWVIQLTEICANYSAGDFYVAELIPEQKLNNAKRTYPLPGGGKPVALIDTTLVGAADDGMLIGEHGVSWHNLATETKVSSLRWRDFLTTTLLLDGSKIKFGEIGVFNTTGNGLGKEKILELLGAIQVGYANYSNRVKPGPKNNNLAEKVSIDVNHASYDDLLSLPGIGAAEAKMIMERRASHPFSSVNDLADFLDLKPHKADQIKNCVIFSAPDRQPAIKTPESPPAIIQAPDHDAPPPAVAKPVTSNRGRMID